MKDQETPHSEEDFDCKNVILSITGAVFITAIGGGLLFWLYSLWMTWILHHPHEAIIACVAFWVLFYGASVVFSNRMQAELKLRQADLQRRMDGKNPPEPKEKIFSL
jgi:O-antigen/teichoic acid export membrane protein